MRFISDRVQAEWKSPKLSITTRLIVEDAARIAKSLGWEMLLTCIYRTQTEDESLGGSGIHVAWRAVDVRTRDVKLEKIDKVVALVNNKWEYDPKRPTMTVAYAKPHGSGLHIHFQSTFSTHIRPIK